MVNHIVMWELLEKANDRSKEDNAHELKSRLSSLPMLIPEIRKYEIGINSGQSSAAMDVVLISAFDNMEDFETYRQHPAHQEVVKYIGTIQSMARVVDFQS